MSRAIEFLFYLNLNFILKIEATCIIARIIWLQAGLIIRAIIDTSRPNFKNKL